MFTISAYLDGELVIDRKLSAIEERTKDMRPAYPEVIRIFREFAARAFATEGASTASGEWAPLKPRTIDERRREGFGPQHPILQRSRRLARSLTEETGDTINVQTPTYLGIGSATPYVVYHQSTAPRRVLPRRPIVNLTEDQKHQLFLPLRRHVTGYEPGAPTRGSIG